MASIEVTSSKRPSDLIPLPPRKRFKATDLPLTQSQRSAIDNLLHIFKKKGEFDALRKKVYAQFEESAAKVTLTSSLHALTEAELERNPALLSKDRRQAAPLIEGAVERSEIYKVVEKDLENFIEEYVAVAEGKLREIRRSEVGEELAFNEERKGSKKDDDYAAEAEVRRQERARVRARELEAERVREREEKRIRAELRRKKQEEEEALERERKEIEEKKRVEREAERKKEEEKQRAWEKELEERRERKKRQDAEWEREKQEKLEKERKKWALEHEKEIEAIALEELIKESKAIAAQKDGVEKPGLKTSAIKESALAAIMREEKLRTEQAKLAKAEGIPEDVVDTANSERKDSVVSHEAHFTERDHMGQEFSRRTPSALKPVEYVIEHNRGKPRTSMSYDDGEEQTRESSHSQEDKGRRQSSRSYEESSRPYWDKQVFRNKSWRREDAERRPSSTAKEEKLTVTSTARATSISEYQRTNSVDLKDKDYHRERDDHRTRSPQPPMRTRYREVSPTKPDIDRYVPSTSHRAPRAYESRSTGRAYESRSSGKDYSRDRDRERERDRLRGRDKDRKYAYDGRERDYERERSRHHHHDEEDRDRDNERRRERDNSRDPEYEKRDCDHDHTRNDDEREYHRKRERDRDYRKEDAEQEEEEHGQPKAATDRPRKDIDRYRPGREAASNKTRERHRDGSREEGKRDRDEKC